MIVCHCNVLKRQSLEEVTDALLDRDPHKLVVPGVVFGTLGCRGKCCGCFPVVAQIIADRIDARVEDRKTISDTEEKDDERRTGSHRAA